MNVQALRYIIAVEHSRSINKAAQHLYVSQSSISRAIKEIEGQIGITLFHRTNKGVIPTYDGQKFIDQARHLLHEMEHLEGQYFRLPGSLRIHCWWLPSGVPLLSTLLLPTIGSSVPRGNC